MNSAQNEAQRFLNKKIEEALSNRQQETILYEELISKWWTKYVHTVKETTSLRTNTNINLINANIDKDIIVNKVTSSYLQDVLDKMYYKDN